MDRAGMILSVLCLVHCLALPPLLAALPLIALSSLPEWLHHSEWVHAALLIPVLLVSGPVLVLAARDVAWLGQITIAAFVLLFGALLAPEHWQEQGLTIGGATLLFVAHLANLRRAKVQ